MDPSYPYIDNNSFGGSSARECECVCDDGDQRQECEHFSSVAWSFALYYIEALEEVARHEISLRDLPETDQEMLMESIDARIDKMKEGVRKNQDFLNKILLFYLMDNCPQGIYPNEQSCEDFQKAILQYIQETDDLLKGIKPPLPYPFTANSPRKSSKTNHSKVRSTLRQFVRDWALEGTAERIQAYVPLLLDLHTYVPLNADPDDPPLKVACPGSGLARLPFEVGLLGYEATGNEFSYHMLIGSNSVLNEFILHPDKEKIQPSILKTTNVRKYGDNLKEIIIPYTAPLLQIPYDLSRKKPLSMYSGEFVEVFQRYPEEYDAVLTSFFLDTGNNVINYVRTIALILKPGGLWSNFGPLLYHFSDNVDSVELSWEELRNIIAVWFDIQSENWADAVYASNQDSMMTTVYRCVHFAALRNDASVVPPTPST